MLNRNCAIPTSWYVPPVPRRTKQAPERGAARIRLLDAATDLIRAQGFAATTVDEICRVAETTKGAFFHHFATKDALGVAVADYWRETTTEFFAGAPFHQADSAAERVLAYVRFRREIVQGPIPDFTCLVGTLVGETHATGPAIREACAQSIFGHAATLEADIGAAIAERGLSIEATPASIARHTQAVIQGAFVLAKAGADPELARESLEHLEHYLALLLDAKTREASG